MLLQSAGLKLGGSRPMDQTGNPTQSFRRKDGTMGKPANDAFRWYNVEGEAFMRQHPGAEIFAFAKLAAAAGDVESINSPYQSWLSAFTHFGDDPAMTRIQKRPGKSNLVVGKVVWCKLLPERIVDGKTIEADTWKSCQGTKDEYLRRTANSKRQREVSTRKHGKLHLVHETGLPPNWDTVMSEQTPLGGYENRGRPPTVVELLAPCYDKHPTVFRYTKSKPTERVSTDHNAPWKDSPAEGLTKFAFLAHAESSIAERMEQDKKAQQDSLLNYPYRDTPTQYRNPMVKQVENSLFGDITVPRLARKYLNWLQCGEGMRAAAYSEPFNYHMPEHKTWLRFNKYRKPYNFNQEHQWVDLQRLNLWLESRDAHNHIRVTVSNEDISTEDVAISASKRLSFLKKMWKAGRIKSEEVYLRNKRLLLNSNRSRLKVNFITIGGTYGDPKRNKPEGWKNKNIDFATHPPVLQRISIISVFSERVGLDTMAPMNDMEYGHITRALPNSVDDHLVEQGLIPESDRSTGDVAMIEGMDDYNYPIMRDVEQETASTNYFINLFRRLGDAGLKILRYPVLVTEAPASRTVDAEVKQPVEDSIKEIPPLIKKANVSEETEIISKSRAKVVLDRIIWLLTN